MELQASGQQPAGPTTTNVQLRCLFTSQQFLAGDTAPQASGCGATPLLHRARLPARPAARRGAPVARPPLRPLSRPGPRMHAAPPPAP
eukprot:56850-Chlamydomonas_euryale.AAC.2